MDGFYYWHAGRYLKRLDLETWKLWGRKKSPPPSEHPENEKQCGHKFTTTVTVQCDNLEGHKGPCHVPKLPKAYVDGLWVPMKETVEATGCGWSTCQCDQEAKQ